MNIYTNNPLYKDLVTAARNIPISNRNYVAKPLLVGYPVTIDDLLKQSSREADGVISLQPILQVANTLSREAAAMGYKLGIHHVLRGDKAVGQRRFSLHHVGLAIDFSLSDRRNKRPLQVLVDGLIASKKLPPVREKIYYRSPNGWWMHLGFAPNPTFHRDITSIINHKKGTKA